MKTENSIGRVNLYVKPTYAVLMPAWQNTSKSRTLLQRQSEINLIDNKHEGKLSKKSITKLRNSINWLVASSKKKKVYSEKRKRHYYFKVNFVTLTLPSSVQYISDHKFKSVLLHNFINQMRYRYGLKNFVWKVETQENGNIHAHFTTDTFLPWDGVRFVWNRILIKNDLMHEYTNKHLAMSFDDYNKTYNAEGKHDIEVVRKRYEKGVSEGWQNPNSTDVHAVYKVKDIAAYLATYMSKKEEGRRAITGRLWSCSYSISEANKQYISMPYDYDPIVIDEMYNSTFTTLPIEIKDKETGEMFKIGEMFTYRPEEVKKIKNTRFAEFYKKILFKIRHNQSFDFDDDLKDESFYTKQFENERKYSVQKIPIENMQIDLPF